MTKQTPAPKVVKTTKKSSKKNVSGNAKKVVAKNTKIVDRSVIDAMTSSEIANSLPKIDFDKVVDYKAEAYQRTKGKKEMTEAFFVTDASGKEHFVGQVLAVALAEAAESDPLGFALQLIAYKKGNPYLTAN